MGEKGGKNLNQISEKDQLITWKEKCSHTETVPPLLFSRAGDAWRNNMQKSKTPPNPKPLFL